MQVSAVSANSSKTVFNTRANYRAGENSNENVLNHLNKTVKSNNFENKNRVFDSINEWKNFCHRQIEKGNLDIVV